MDQPSRQQDGTAAPQIDRYDLVMRLGQGGMASVWLAREIHALRGARFVAIKVMSNEVRDHRKARAMFLEEVRIASAIHHPNVGAILDFRDHGGHLHYVMEYIDGFSVSALADAAEMRGAAFPIDVILGIAAQAARGLHAAHELRDHTGTLLGVVHRDISPRNLLVTSQGTVKLIDFGVVKAVSMFSWSRTVARTTTDVVKGSARYLSPEQVTGKTIDRRTDLWSLGALLYRLLVGRAPYEASDDVTSIANNAMGRPIARLPGTVPRRVAELVETLLDREPDRRPPDALEVARAIDRIAKDEGADPSPQRLAEFATSMLAEPWQERHAAIERALGTRPQGARPPPTSHVAPARSTRRASRSRGRYLAAATALALTALALFAMSRAHHQAPRAPAPAPPMSDDAVGR